MKRKIKLSEIDPWWPALVFVFLCYFTGLMMNLSGWVAGITGFLSLLATMLAFFATVAVGVAWVFENVDA